MSQWSVLWGTNAHSLTPCVSYWTRIGNWWPLLGHLLVRLTKETSSLPRCRLASSQKSGFSMHVHKRFLMTLWREQSPRKLHHNTRYYDPISLKVATGCNSSKNIENARFQMMIARLLANVQWRTIHLMPDKYWQNRLAPCGGLDDHGVTPSTFYLEITTLRNLGSLTENGCCFMMGQAREERLTIPESIYPERDARSYWMQKIVQVEEIFDFLIDKYVAF